MIILIYGNDELRSRDKYRAFSASLLAKNPKASLFKLTNENFTSQALEELTKGQGLFYQKFIVGCDNLFSSVKGNEEVLGEAKDWLSLMTRSDNVFILLENNTDEKVLVELENLASRAQKFEKKVGELSKHGAFNIFSITDAFAAKNKNRAWALYQEALMHGISAEEILWKLIWSTNNLLLVKNTRDASKLKMKPYPLTKAKTAAKTFSNEELKKISASFLDLYHTTYLGTDEFEFGLEKILLSV